MNALAISGPGRENAEMLLYDPEIEIGFSRAIDCQFPYHDPPSSSLLIQRGWSISLNASFGVLHELCRIPKSTKVTRDRQRKLIADWNTGHEHPLKAPVVGAAHSLVNDDPLPWQQTLRLMNLISKYDNQYAALSIAYFASEADNAESNNAIELAHGRICQLWSRLITRRPS